MQALTLAHQSQTTLLNLYQSWMDCVQSLLAAKRTGNFNIAGTPARAAIRRRALQECDRLELEATRLRTQAVKEKQLARQVELNLALQRVQAQLIAARQQL